MPAPDFIGSVNTTDASIGLGADETGIIVDSMDMDLDNPEIAFLDRFGGETGYAVNYNPKLNFTLSGEVSDKDAGVNVITFTALASIANSDFFESTAGTYHGLDFDTAGAEVRLTSVSGSQPRGGARTITANLSRPLGFSF